MNVYLSFLAESLSWLSMVYPDRPCAPLWPAWGYVPSCCRGWSVLVCVTCCLATFWGMWIESAAGPGVVSGVSAESHCTVRRVNNTINAFATVGQHQQQRAGTTCCTQAVCTMLHSGVILLARGPIPLCTNSWLRCVDGVSRGFLKQQLHGSLCMANVCCPGHRLRSGSHFFWQPWESQSCPFHLLLASQQL